MVRPKGRTPSLHAKQGKPTPADEQRWARRQAVVEKYAKQRAQEDKYAH